MIALLQGQIAEKTATGVVIDAGGVGYEVLVPTSVLARLGEVGEPARLRTILEVREDAMTLFGFLERSEQEMFRLLTTISGIGSKMALAILSGMTPQQVLEAVAREDVTSFSRVRGVGKKTAAKLIFELRSKVGDLPPLASASGTRPGTVWLEASEALRSLGYKELEIGEALAWTAKQLGAEDSADVTMVLRKALAYFQQPAGA
jgi:Holliday junction DNA helicase RuvA